MRANPNPNPKPKPKPKANPNPNPNPTGLGGDRHADGLGYYPNLAKPGPSACP